MICTFCGHSDVNLVFIFCFYILKVLTCGWIQLRLMWLSLYGTSSKWHSAYCSYKDGLIEYVKILHVWPVLILLTQHTTLPHLNLTPSPHQLSTPPPNLRLHRFWHSLLTQSQNNHIHLVKHVFVVFFSLSLNPTSPSSTRCCIKSSSQNLAYHHLNSRDLLVVFPFSPLFSSLILWHLFKFRQRRAHILILHVMLAQGLKKSD